MYKIEVYEAFEKGLGKKDAKMVVKSIETTIGNATANSWEKTKNELYDRLVSKEEFKGFKEEVNENFKSLKEEVRGLGSKIYDINNRIDGINNRIDETNKRIDSVMKIQLWIMGLIAVQAVAVIVKLIFS